MSFDIGEVREVLEKLSLVRTCDILLSSTGFPASPAPVWLRNSICANSLILHRRLTCYLVSYQISNILAIDFQAK